MAALQVSPKSNQEIKCFKCEDLVILKSNVLSLTMEIKMDRVTRGQADALDIKRENIWIHLPVNLWGRDVMSNMGVDLYSPSKTVSQQMFNQGLLPSSG